MELFLKRSVTHMRSSFQPSISPATHLRNVQKPVNQSRFSRDEFCHLMDSHLRKLETCLDAQNQYGAVLLVLRQNLEDYKKTKSSATKKDVYQRGPTINFLPKDK
jgi:hypothetical protein